MDRFPFEQVGGYTNLLQVTKQSTAMLPQNAIFIIKCKELKNCVTSLVKLSRKPKRTEKIIFNEQDTIYLVQDKETCYRIKFCNNGCQGCIPSEKCGNCEKMKFYHGK